MIHIEDYEREALKDRIYLEEPILEEEFTFPTITFKKLDNEKDICKEDTREESLKLST